MNYELYSFFIDLIDEFFITKEVFTTIFTGIVLAIIFFLIRDYISRRTNLSGKWKMYETTMSSDFNPYIGMKLISTINILHSEKNIIGSGEKTSEITIQAGEKKYLPEERIKYSIQGNFEWRFVGPNKIKFIYEHTSKNGRSISSFINLKTINKNRLEGWFISEAANSSGTITLIKDDFSEFGKGYLFRSAIIASKILNVKLVGNIEHHYLKYFSRSKNLNPENKVINKILIEIEDPNFYHHQGIVFKSLLRGLLSRNKFIRRKFKLIKSGGSTLTMQLARTLFIKDYEKKWRRKILEIIFAIHLENILSKTEIIHIYLSSVRFHYKVYGIKQAIHFYNFNEYENLTEEEAFFMIERLSNTSNNYSRARIKLLRKKLEKQHIYLDFHNLKNIYQKSNYIESD